MAERSTQIVPIDAVLETERCCLRYPQMSDAQRAFSAFISPFFPKLLPLGQIRSLGETRNWIERAQAGWSAGEAYTWTIERKEDALVVGQVTLTKSSEPDRWALAFWIHPENWGVGFATEAAKKATEFAFMSLGANTVWAGTCMWNEASAVVLNKLGMVFVAENPEGYVINDQTVPTQEYEITVETWQRNQGID